MTWSVEYDTRHDGDIKVFGDDTPEVNAAMQAAVDAVGEILAAGTLGNKDDYSFSVRIVGHTNPNHAPLSGWSNDSLSINIYQLSEEL